MIAFGAKERRIRRKIYTGNFKMVYVLGISCFYHDSAACLVKDGKVIAAASEERFSRQKHDNRFPYNAIDYCLKEGGIKINDVDYIGFYEKPLVKFERILTTNITTYPLGFWQFYKAIPSWVTQKLKIPTILGKIGYKKDVIFINHHLSHASSAFFVSPFEKAAILTFDGVGEWDTASCGIGAGNKINLVKEMRFPNSLGLLYSAVTAYLGFDVNNDEYKVMGLAPYGEPTYYEKFNDVINIKDDGSFRLNEDYFAYHYKMMIFSSKFVREFGEPRKKNGKMEERHMDIASSLQKITEEVVVRMAKNLQRETGMQNLVLAGGVAMNSVANGKILRYTKLKRLFVQHASSDSGGALGVAFYIYNQVLNNKRNYVMEHAYLGPKFSTDKIREFLDKNNVKYEEMPYDKIIRKTARLISEDKVVGWFQGGMEWGERALGNRSILANPCNAEMKDIVNKKVKHREEFRPFAPSVILEEAPKYFDMLEPVPFMLEVYDVKKGKDKIIPAVTHVDGSARLQTVTKESNPLYYALIKEFKRITGVPVVLNTSFNVKGEPIVCTPEDAYKCFIGTEIDYLAMDKFLIQKQ